MMPPEPWHAVGQDRDETRLIRLSAADQRRFVVLLLDPPEPAPALRRAKGAHARLFETS
jgi:uncharacterized protein (DUF1778 family)